MATRKKATKTTKCSAEEPGPNDPATEYAVAVTEGKILAGPWVRAACRRHLKDLQDGAARGLVWDLAAQHRVLKYFRTVLRLNGGKFEGLPYEPLPEQCFILGSLFGWKKADGFRRFNIAFVEEGKGNGKSPLAAGIGLYLETADLDPHTGKPEARAEVYAAATKKDQAMVLFRDAVAMVDQSPKLQRRILKSGGKGKEWNLAYLKTGSFFRAISSEDGQSGPRPHGALLDEIHEHRDDTMVEMMLAGLKFRSQPLVFMITNSGINRKESVCKRYHDYAVEVAQGIKEDDSFFAYVCALDEGDDPFKDTACWPKANPALGITIREDYLKRQVTQARGMPAKESVVRRLNFCQWVDAVARIFDPELWDAVQGTVDLEPLKGTRCNAGLDLSGKNDLTALSLTFPDTKPMPAKTFFWTPKETMRARGERDKVPYTLWEEQKHLEGTPGKSIDYAFVAKKLGWIAATFTLQELAFDRYRIDDLKRELDNQGVDCHEFDPDPETGEDRGSGGFALVKYGQGFVDMAPAVDAIETAVMNAEIVIDKSPVMEMCAANAALEQDAAGNRKFTKAKSTGRIDGMVSLAMAVRRAQLIGEGGGSYLDKADGILLLD